MSHRNQMHISSDFTEKIKSTYFNSMVVLFASTVLLLIALFGISIELFASIFLFGMISIAIRFLVNDLVDVSLIEDYLIIKQSVGKNMIAPINKIRKCRTKYFLNIALTSFELNIDGSKKKVFFFSSTEQNQMFNQYRLTNNHKAA
jgi:hypothetical protein